MNKHSPSFPSGPHPLPALEVVLHHVYPFWNSRVLACVRERRANGMHFLRLKIYVMSTSFHEGAGLS